MRALIQRVRWAKVEVEGEVVGRIGPGILTFLGVAKGDDVASMEGLISKILRLRIFEDEAGKMNRSLLDVGGEHLIVSQFTLYGDCSQGNRPSFVAAAPAETAREVYLKALAYSAAQGVRTEAGRFQADMKVSLENDGPVTLWLER
jgi:D-tyrosyl-tRNA(Tyr) deacylase